MIRAALLGLALALTVVSPTAAQDDLGNLFDSIASLWARGDASRLAEFAAGTGLELEVHGQPVDHLGFRRVAAALRRVFDNQETVSVVAAMTSRVTGTNDRAFGELTWDLRTLGTEVAERNTIFVALVREPVGWRISHIRISR